MNRGLVWFPVPVQLLGTLEFRRLAPELLGTWVRLVALSAEREGGGRIPGVADWRRDEYPALVGAGTTRGTIERLVEAGLARWDGSALVVEHYPERAEKALQKQREGGANAHQTDAIRPTNEPHPDNEQTPSDQRTDQVRGVGSAESLDSGARVGGTQPRGVRVRERVRGRSTASGDSLREPPDPAEAQIELFGEPIALPPPKAKRPPPWRRMLDRFAEGAGERWTETPVDRGLAVRLSGLAADLKASGVTAGDLVRAGAYAARGRREQLTPSWTATTGRLVEAIGRSKHAETSPIADDAGWTVIRGGKAASAPQSDDPPLAAAADPPS